MRQTTKRSAGQRPWRWVAGPNANTEDDKPKQRFVGLPSAAAARKPTALVRLVSPPALRALCLRAIFRRPRRAARGVGVPASEPLGGVPGSPPSKHRRAFDRACFANTLRSK
jgi:hypothetical protein